MAVQGVALSTGRVEIGWAGPGGGPTSLVALVDSAIVGTNVLGLTAWDQTYDGPLDDITATVLAVHITRGRADPTTVLSAGSATITGRDPTGIFNPKNDASTLAGNLVPLRMGRVAVTYAGGEHFRFVGFIRSIEWRPMGRSGEYVIELVDLFVWLERFYPTIGATGTITTGAAIGLILDNVGWVDPAMRALDSGDTLGDFSADGTKTAITLIEELLTAERGFFYISPAGVATYKDRHARAKSTTLGTIVNVMSEIAPGMALDNVKNRASVTKTGGATKTSTNSASIAQYGDRGFDPIDSPYIADDNTAQSLADWLVATNSSPTAPLWKLTAANRVAATYDLLLRADITSSFTVTEAQGGTSDDFIIEGYDESIEPSSCLHEWQFSLTVKPTSQDIIVGVSTVGGTDVLGF